MEQISLKGNGIVSINISINFGENNSLSAILAKFVSVMEWISWKEFVENFQKIIYQMGLTHFIAFIEEFWKDSLLNNTKKERLWLIENIYITEYQTIRRICCWQFLRHFVSQIEGFKFLISTNLLLLYMVYKRRVLVTFAINTTDCYQNRDIN